MLVDIFCILLVCLPSDIQKTVDTSLQVVSGMKPAKKPLPLELP